MALGSSGNCSVRCCSLTESITSMSFLLLFQNLLHELENRSLFHHKKSVPFRSYWNTENFLFYLLLSWCHRISCRGQSHPERIIPHQQANKRSQHSAPLSVQEAAECSARRCCSTAARLCLQDVPGVTKQCSLCPSPGHPCVPAPAARPGHLELTTLLCSGRTWLHPFLTAWCKTLPIARTALWSVGGWFSLVFLGVGLLSFPLIYHVIHC